MTIGFIGVGNMGGALAAAVAKSGADLLLADRDAAKTTALAEQLGATATDNARVAGESEYIFLGVKPQVLPALLEELKAPLAARKNPPVLVSMAAGFATERITAGLGVAYPLIRIMPNTPAMVGEGMTAACPNQYVTEKDKAYALKLLGAFGKVEVVPEHMIDAVVAVSGSSPAYVFMLIEAMADGAVAEGMPRAQAYEFAAQAVYGSAKMVLETKKHPGELKDMVCSPAGTTIEAVRVLEQSGFRSAVIEAEKACAEVSRSL